MAEMTRGGIDAAIAELDRGIAEAGGDPGFDEPFLLAMDEAGVLGAYHEPGDAVDADHAALLGAMRRHAAERGIEIAEDAWRAVGPEEGELRMAFLAAERGAAGFSLEDVGPGPDLRPALLAIAARLVEDRTLSAADGARGLVLFGAEVGTAEFVRTHGAGMAFLDASDLRRRGDRERGEFDRGL